MWAAQSHVGRTTEDTGLVAIQSLCVHKTTQVHAETMAMLRQHDHNMTYIVTHNFGVDVSMLMHVYRDHENHGK